MRAGWEGNLFLIVRMDDYEDRLRMAERADLSPKKLAILAQDQSTMVRLIVAQHGLTPASALEELSKDPEVAIRCKVAGHRRLPIKCLVSMANDRALGVQEEVAMSLQTRATEVAKSVPRKELLEMMRKSPALIKGALAYAVSKLPDGAVLLADSN